jgi:hypothetical protein
VRAAIAILRSGDPTLSADVLSGRLPLLPTARKIRARNKIVAAYAQMTAEDKAVFGKTIGADEIFNNVVTPALDTAQARAAK